MKSIGQMIQQIAGLLGTDDANDWETGFIQSIVQNTNNGKQTSHLTTKQADTVERIWKKHYA